MEKQIGYIYKLICPLTNDVIYIGKTTNTLTQRLNKHISKTKTKIRYNRKLSKNEYWIKKLIDIDCEKNIKIEIIEECSIYIINEREIYWIAEFRKSSKINNLTDGGDGGLGYKHTEEELIKMSINRKGKCLGKEHPFYGTKRSKETKEKISAAMSGEHHPFYGTERSKETKEKISKSNSGENNGMYGVRTKRTEEQKLNLSKSLKNSTKLKESRKSEEYKEKISNFFSIPIVVLDTNFNIIDEFKNCRECSEKYNYTPGNIKNAIRFKRIIGKGRRDKFWIVRKENLDNFLLEMKS